MVKPHNRPTTILSVSHATDVQNVCLAYGTCMTVPFSKFPS